MMGEEYLVKLRLILTELLMLGLCRVDECLECIPAILNVQGNEVLRIIEGELET
jgi:hypothetical protein